MRWAIAVSCGICELILESSLRKSCGLSLRLSSTDVPHATAAVVEYACVSTWCQSPSSAVWTARCRTTIGND